MTFCFYCSQLDEVLKTFPQGSIFYQRFEDLKHGENVFWRLVSLTRNEDKEYHNRIRRAAMEDWATKQERHKED